MIGPLVTSSPCVPPFGSCGNVPPGTVGLFSAALLNRSCVLSRFVYSRNPRFNPAIPVGVFPVTTSIGACQNMWSVLVDSPSDPMLLEGSDPLGGFGNTFAALRSMKSARPSAGHASGNARISPNTGDGFVPIPAGVPPDTTNTVPASSTVIPEWIVASTWNPTPSAILKVFAVVAPIAAAALVPRMSGPLPSTNTLKLFTPGVSVCIPLPGGAGGTGSGIPVVAGSANPSPTGNPPSPPTGAPVIGFCGNVHGADDPTTSANLMIIVGVAPSVVPAVEKNPSVPCVNASSPGSRLLATAAYTVLHGPHASAMMFPDMADVPE